MYFAAEALHRLCNAVLIGRNDLAQVFGVDACRERCGAHQVGEHHSDLAALGHVHLGCGGRCRSRSIGCKRGFIDNFQFGYRAQQKTPVTERRDANLFEVLICQIRQDDKAVLSG